MSTPIGSSAKPSSSEKGFILVAVLMVSTIFLTMAVSFAWYARLQLRMVQGERQMVFAKSMAFSLTYTVARGLKMDTNNYDSFGEDWFQQLIFPMGPVLISLRITPLDDKLPINYFFLPDGLTPRIELKRPWEELWNLYDLKGLGPKILDYIDKDESPRLGGGEPGTALNRPLGDLGELLYYKGITPELLWEGVSQGTYQEKPPLDEYITVYCNKKINVNTVSPRVFALLHKDLTLDLGEDLEEWRKEHPVESLSDLEELSGFPPRALPRLMSLLKTVSSYFSVDIAIAWPGQSRIPDSRYAAVLYKSGSDVSLVSWKEQYE